LKKTAGAAPKKWERGSEKTGGAGALVATPPGASIQGSGAALRRF